MMNKAIESIFLFVPALTQLLFWIICQILPFTLPSAKDPQHVINNQYSDITKEIDIFWETEGQCTGVLQYWKENKINLLNTVEEKSPAIQHKIHLNSLDSNQQNYNVTCKEFKIKQAESTFSFTIMDKYSAEKIIVATADLQPQIGMSHNRRVLHGIMRHIPEFAPLIVAGDFVWLAGKDEWNDLFRLARPIFYNKTVIPIAGNHDMDFKSPNLTGFQADQFGWPNENSADPKIKQKFFHSVDYGNIIIICLSWTFVSDEKFEENAEMQWFINQLKSYQDKEFKIVVLHQNVQQGWKQGTPPETIKEMIKLCDEQNVNLILHGHHHMYGRWNIQTKTKKNIPVVDLGGGGAIVEIDDYWTTFDIYDTIGTPQAFNKGPFFTKITVKNKQLLFEAFSPWGALIDSFQIEQKNNQNVYLDGFKETNKIEQVVLAQMFEMLSLAGFLTVQDILLAIALNIYQNSPETLLQIYIAKESWASMIWADSQNKTIVQQENLERNYNITGVSKESKEIISLSIEKNHTQRRLSNGNAHITSHVKPKQNEKNSKGAILCRMILDLLIGCFSSFIIVQLSFAITSFVGIFIVGIQGHNNVEQFLANQIIFLLANVYFTFFLIWLQPRLLRLIWLGILFIFSFIFVFKMVFYVQANEFFSQYYLPLFAILCGFGLEIIQIMVSVYLTLKLQKESNGYKKLFMTLFGNLFERNPSNKFIKFLYSSYFLSVVSVISIAETCCIHFGMSLSSFAKYY